MKNDVRKLAFVFAAAALLAGGTVAHVSSAEVLEVGAAGETKTVTYTVTSIEAVSTSGEAPVGSSASYNQTYNTKQQLTGGNTATLSLKDLGGIDISNITFSMRSNSKSGAGSLTYKVNDGSSTTLISNSKFNDSAFGGKWSASFIPVSKDVELTQVNDLDLVISASANSLFIESYTITYSEGVVATSPLSRIEIGGDAANKEYFAGDKFDTSGLTVTAFFEDNTSMDVTKTTSWSMDPNPLTAGATEVKVTASVTVNDVTKTATKLIEGITVKESNAHTYQLLTNVNDLKIGSQVIVANEGATMALGTDQKLNNRAAVPTGDRLVNSNLVVDTGKDSDIEVFTVEAGTKENTFAFKSTSSSLYIYAASSSKNYLRSQTEKDDNASFAVEVTGSVVKVTAQGTSTRNLLKYNDTDKIFSCYSNGQKDISMYVYNAAPELSGDGGAFIDTLLNDLHCDGGVTPVTETAWNDVAEFYTDLPDSDKAMMKNAKADAASEFDLEKAMAKYDYIVGKYGYTDYIGREPAPAQANNVLPMMSSNEKTTILLSVMGVAGVALAGAFFLSRKRKMAR